MIVIIVTSGTFIAEQGLDYFQIGKLAFYLIYKPILLFFVHSFIKEVKKDGNDSDEKDSAVAAKAILYVEIVSNKH